MPEPTPVKYMRMLAEYFPNIWEFAEKYRLEENTRYPEKPPWCYISAGLTSVLHKVLKNADYDLNADTLVYRMGLHLTLWRLGQGIYKFSDELSEELNYLDTDTELPKEFFLNLPEWCIYIDMTNAFRPKDDPNWAPQWVSGAFVALTWHPGDSAKGDSCFLLITILRERTTADGEIEFFPTPVLIDLYAKQTIRQAVAEMLDVLDEELIEGQITPQMRSIAQTEIQKIAAAVVNRVIYICCVNADMRNRRNEKPRKPRPVKTATGPKLFPATNPTVWEVGYRIGQVLRLARERTRQNAPRAEESPRKKMVPHMRRAHIHHYWIGKRTDPTQRKLIGKFLHPMLINCEDPDKMVPTVHPVE